MYDSTQCDFGPILASMSKVSKLFNINLSSKIRVFRALLASFEFCTIHRHHVVFINYSDLEDKSIDFSYGREDGDNGGPI